MSQDVTDVFGMFDTSVVADALDDHGIDGVVTGIEPVVDDWHAVGRAHTMNFEVVENPGSGETNFPYAMLSELREDRLLVIDGTGPERSCWGGNASRLAVNAGVEGVVIDGGYRDVPDIRDGSFPVFGRARTPRTSQRRVTVESVGEPVTVDGVEVATGDVVVADATGVVVVPADDAAAVAETAEEILAEERLLEAKIDSGATVGDLRADGHSF